MRRGQIIKHKMFMDVACEILRVIELPHKLKLKVQWINQGFVDTFAMILVTNIEIKREKLDEWLICNEPRKQCIRDAEWRQAK